MKKQPTPMLWLLLCLLLASCQNGKNVSEETNATSKQALSVDTKDSLVLHEKLKKIKLDSQRLKLAEEKKFILKMDTAEVEVKLTGNFYWTSCIKEYQQEPCLTIHESTPGVLFNNKYAHYSYVDENGKSQKGKYTIADKLRYFDDSLNLLNTISLDAYNPYTEFDKPVAFQNFWSETSYVENPDISKTVKYWTVNRLQTLRNEIPVAVYNKYFIDENDQVLHTEVTIVVFDKKGNYIGSVKDIPHYVSHYAVSNDGKYLGVNIGEQAFGLPEEVLFYEVQTGKILYHLKEKTGIVGAEGIGLLCVEKWNYGHEKRYVFDFNSMTLYSKQFTPKEGEELGKLWFKWERQGLSPTEEAIKHFKYDKESISAAN